VVDVHSGRVLALYSRPSIDPNQMALGLSQQLAREIDENPDRPRIDRSIYETYYPGSTVKPFTALAALRAGLWQATQRNNCTGNIEIGHRHWHCAHGHVHGLVDLHEAIVQSCNIYFFQLAQSITMDMIARTASEYGLGQRTGIGINAESAGLVPTRDWYTREFHRFRLGFQLNSAIGQGATRLTVLQLALAYAALANGGDLYVPQIVERIEGPDGTVLQDFPPSIRHHIDIPPADLDRVRAGLRGVVAEVHGTAHAATNIPEVEIAGKTGTAQVSRVARQGEDPRRAWYMGRDHAWFAAFAPYQNPEIAIVVLVEHGGSGGDEAAPIVAQVVRDYFTRIRPGDPIPSVRAIREEQEGAAARQRARNRH
jgi:penicillin-binding protein 2